MVQTEHTYLALLHAVLSYSISEGKQTGAEEPTKALFQWLKWIANKQLQKHDESLR